MKKTILSVAAIAAMAFNVVSPMMSPSVQAKTTSNYACGDSLVEDYDLSYGEGDVVTKTLGEEINGLYVGKGADVTIDMNGFSILDFWSSISEYEGPYLPTYLSICVEEGGKLSLSGEGYIEEDIVNMGSMHINGRILAEEPFINYGEAVIDDMILNDYELINGDDSGFVESSKLTINGGQFNDGYSLDLDLFNYGQSELIINGGVFGADDTDTMVRNHGKTTITNGKFVSQSGSSIVKNYNDNVGGNAPKSDATNTNKYKPELYISGGEFESIYAEPEAGPLSITPNPKPQLDYEPVGECVDADGYSTDNADCITQISGGYYRYFAPNPDFFVEGYKDFDVDADTVQVRGTAPKPEAKPEEPKEEVKNPDTFDGLTGLISALSISFISGFGLVNFLKHRR